MNVAAACKRLRLSARTVEALCRSGGLKARKVNGRWEIVPISSDHLFTVRSLAEAMDVSDAYVRRLCVDGTLAEAFKLGASWRIPMEAAVELMKRRLL